MNLRSFDLNLLPVFEAVFEERNMTRAALRLGLSQSTVSNAVTRLRHASGDELFVAGRRGITPTPLAEEMFPEIQAALAAVREALGRSRDFDPRTAERRFRIGLLYGPGAALGQELFRSVQREAPHVSLRFVQFDDREAAYAALREGKVDFLFDMVQPTKRDLESEALFKDELVVIAAEDHPRVRDSLTREQFISERHAAHASLRWPGSLPEIEAALGFRALDVAIEVRIPMELPVAVSGSELLAVCTRRLAEPWAKLLRLRVLAPPFVSLAFSSYLVWHATRHRDAGHAWLRGVIVRQAKPLRVAA
jgi:LysR family transcriptional activator for leuABCD operon